MGEQLKNTKSNKKDSQVLQSFIRHLLDDIKALAYILENGLLEDNIIRIGAEQEICLVDRKSLRPAPKAMEVLAALNEPHFTNELAVFNLELNLDPIEFHGNCLQQMENQLKTYLEMLESCLHSMNLDYVLTGILPTIHYNDLTLENITPLPRYKALDAAINQLRGSDFELRIEGTDELIANTKTIMFESCNTSFQLHYQTPPQDFVDLYNWAQALAGPIISAATNSPLLLGKRLWRETRIALFQQATDTRKTSDYLREKEARVLFGSDWIHHSILETFREDIARHKVLLYTEIEENAIETLRKGGIPQLKALRLHNGTIYKWNRACYGIINGKPHLRIENRVLPAGPSIIDEMANAAFWFGLMHNLPPEYRNLQKKVEFDVVKINFLRAVRTGLGSMFRWLDGKAYSAAELLLKELMPISEEGLKKANIPQEDIEKYLNVMKERIETEKTGSQWTLDAYAKLKKQGKRDEALVALTAGMLHRSRSGEPVHKWNLPEINEAGSWINYYWKVEQIMSKDLYTVGEEDPVSFAINVMNWRQIRHLPVENPKGELTGLITMELILQKFDTLASPEGSLLVVKDIMIKEVICTTEDTLTIDAIALMEKNHISCLPVVNKNNHLVGIVTEHDFLNVANHFLQEFIESYIKTEK
ncbi:MAG: CBS domain-containing protein [Bacteroidia bacterium]|nr:CBS domain-containing protein [Bacteroidia bacterium]MDW8157725.1 CBS domain-containing protein [Bacteroidia bacterium]